jgi:hypothetical protein
LPFDDQDEIVLGYRTTIKGFTIDIDEVDGVLKNMKCIIDKLSNKVHNLKQSPYSTTEKEPLMTVLYCVTLTKH